MAEQPGLREKISKTFEELLQIIEDHVTVEEHPVYGEIITIKPSAREKLEAVGEDVKKETENIREKIKKEIGDAFADLIKGLVDAILNTFVLASFSIGYALGGFGLGQEIGTRLARKRWLESTGDPNLIIPSLNDILFLTLRGHLPEERGAELAKEWGISPYWWDLLKWTQKAIVSPSEIRELYRRKFIDTKTAFDLLKLHGYDHVHASLLLGLSYRRLDPSTAIGAWLRGFISEKDLDLYLEAEGFLDSDREVLKRMAFVIPSVTDLIRMAVREAFNPEAIRTFQLDQDYPEELTQWAEAQGLSKDWAMKYWIAHWELPSLTQGFEMLHRTTKEPLEPNADPVTSPWGETRYTVIGQETLRMLMRAQDISPFWRPLLEQISYLPLTRVDVRRAYDLGILTESDVYFAYRDIGYNDQNARILTEFTILQTIAEERNRVRNELIELYELGTLTRDELRENLKSLKYADRVIDFLVAFAEYRKTRKHIERLLRRYKAEYLRGDISDSELHDRLVRLGLETEDVLRIQEEWQAEKIARERTLTKADIRTALAKRIITEDQARDKLERLGYSEEDIDILIRMWRA